MGLDPRPGTPIRRTPLASRRGALRGKTFKGNPGRGKTHSFLGILQNAPPNSTLLRPVSGGPLEPHTQLPTNTSWGPGGVLPTAFINYTTGAHLGFSLQTPLFVVFLAGGPTTLSSAETSDRGPIRPTNTEALSLRPTTTVERDPTPSSLSSSPAGTTTRHCRSYYTIQPLSPRRLTPSRKRGAADLPLLSYRPTPY